MPGGRLLTAGRAQAFTFVASATSTGTTITIPATAQPGDLAVLFNAIGASSVTAAVPTGFTSIIDTSLLGGLGGDNRSIASYKRLVTGEPNSVITGMTGGDAGFRTMIMLVFRPIGRIAVVTIPAWTGQATDGNPTLQTVVALGLPVPLIVFGLAWAFTAGTVAFSTASPAFDATVTLDGGSAYLIVGYKIYNSAPADHSIDKNDDGSGNTLQSGLIRCQ